MRCSMASPTRSTRLCSHEDEVETLPAGAELLASNAVSRVAGDG